MMIRIRAADPLEAFRVRLTFSDGSQKIVDLEPYLHGPIFGPLRADPHLFRSVRVDPELGTIVWPNGADIDPDVLYHGLTPAWLEAERSPEKRVW
jgi:hypothetical protein